jgi:nucleoside-diphosphate-sugar epimerase
MELVVARVSEVWGPGGGGQGSLVRAVASGRFRLIGDGDVAHQMAYVDDVAAALELCGRVPVTGVRRYLISGPPATFADFVHALARAAGSRVGTAPALGPPARAVLAGLSRARLAPALANVLDYHLRPRAYDLRRSRAELGPYHHTNADAGVRATLDWHLGDERRG